MATSALDTRISAIKARLTHLDRAGVTCFGLSCAERFAILYKEFSEEERWGSPVALDEIRGAMWQFVGGTPMDRGGLEAALAAIETLIPHADDFGSNGALLAQASCGCLDAAVRSSLGGTEGTSASGTALYAVRMAVCLTELGIVDTGQGPEEDAFEARLLDEPRILKELSAQEKAIDLLATGQLDSGLVERVRDLSLASRWTTRELLPYQ